VPPRAVRTHPVYVAQGLLSPPVPGRSVVFALISWSISTAKDGLRTHGQIVACECVRPSSFFSPVARRFLCATNWRT